MSSRYRRVKTSMHSDEKYQQLSRPQPNGQSLWGYLLHGPYTTLIPGVVVGGRAGMAEALGWEQEGFDKAFQEVLDLGMAKADWKARLVWLPRGPYHNGPESPNVIKGWAKFWPEVPSCDLKAEIFQGLEVYVEGLTRPFQEAFTKAFTNTGTGTGTGTEIVLPAWLDVEAWGEWIAYRKERRLTMTPTTVKLQLALLERFKSQQREIIEASISSGWQGLFNPKESHGNRGKGGGTSAPERVRDANKHLEH